MAKRPGFPSKRKPAGGVPTAAPMQAGKAGGTIMPKDPVKGFGHPKATTVSVKTDRGSFGIKG